MIEGKGTASPTQSQDLASTWHRLGLILAWFLGAAALAWVVLNSSLASYDTWWHIANGRFIFQHHTIPLQDYYSWTVIGRWWDDQSWLYDAGSYLLVHWLNTLGLMLINWLPLAASLAALAWLVADDGPGWSFPLTAAVMLAFAVPMKNLPLARPHALSLLFVILTYGAARVIDRHRRSWIRIILLPAVITVLWANVSSTVILAVVFWLGETVLWLFDPARRRHWYAPLAALLVTAVTWLALTPQHWRGMMYPINQYFYGPMHNYIGEWHAPGWDGSYGKLQLALILAALLVGAFSTTRLSVRVVRDWALMIVFSVMAITTIRFGMYLPVVFYLGARQLALWLARTDGPGRRIVDGMSWVHYVYRWPVVARAVAMMVHSWRWLVGRGNRLLAAYPRLTGLAVVLVGLLFFAWPLHSYTGPPPLNEPINRVNTYSRVPGDIIDELKSAPWSKNMHLFNMYALGGSLIYNQIPVFWDGREDVYVPNHLFEHAMQVQQGDRPPGPFFDQWGIDTVLTRVNNQGTSALGNWLSAQQDWVLVFRDGNNVIYRKQVQQKGS